MMFTDMNVLLLLLVSIFLHIAELQLHHSRQSRQNKFIHDEFSVSHDSLSDSLTQTETIAVSNVIAIASLVSEIWLATERQTDTHTDTVLVSSVKFSKVAHDFAKKKSALKFEFS